MIGKSKLMADVALRPPSTNNRAWSVYRADPEGKKLKTILMTMDESKAIEAVQLGGSLCRYFEMGSQGLEASATSLHKWLRGLGYSKADMERVHEDMLSDIADGMVGRTFVP
jgi:hypothetical protein